MHEERRTGSARPLPPRPLTRPSVAPGARAPLPSDPATLPALPPSFAASILAAAASWGLVLDEPLLAAFDAHARLLLAWTVAINLTAVRDPERVAMTHVLDSLSAVPLLRRLAPERPRLADLGSGGGYPGLTVAAALPAGSAMLIESVGKKARFLAVAAAATGAALADSGAEAPAIRVAARRAEAMAAEYGGRGVFDVVTARAVGSLGRLAALGLPLLRPGGLLVAWKRDGGDGRLQAELDDAAAPTTAARGRPWRLEALPPGVTALATHRLVVTRRR